MARKMVFSIHLIEKRYILFVSLAFYLPSHETNKTKNEEQMNVIRVRLNVFLNVNYEKLGLRARSQLIIIIELDFFSKLILIDA